MKYKWKTKAQKMWATVKVGKTTVSHSVYAHATVTGMKSVKFEYHTSPTESRWYANHKRFGKLEDALAFAETVLDKKVARAKKEEAKYAKIQAANKARKARDEAVIKKLLANGSKSTSKDEVAVAKRIANLISKAN